MKEFPWPVSRLSRYLVGLRDGTHGSFDRVAEGVPLLSAKNVRSGGVSVLEESMISVDDAASIISSGFPRRDDVLLTIVGTVGRSAVYDLDESLPFQRSVAFLRPDERMDSRFLKYQLDSAFVQDQMGLATKTSAQPGLYLGDVAAVRVVVPPRLKQGVIADYLDRETARIDTLIEEQQRLVEMLRDRRRDLIRSRVLGTLSPFDLPTGSPAIGHHFAVTLGKMLDAGRSVRDGDNLLPYLRAGNLQDSGLRLDDVKFMPYSTAEAASLDLRAGDLLVVEGGAVGTNVLLERDMPGWSFQKTVNRVRASGAWSSAWLGYLLRTYRDIGVIDIVCNKSTIPHLTAEKLRALRIPNTDPGEQRQVVAYLDEQTGKIDTLIEETAQFIELARERRAALITAAVTGQIDVREEAA